MQKIIGNSKSIFILLDLLRILSGVKKQKKILFVITDLRGGGAEKILVNILNKLSPEKFDLHLLTIFKEGIYRKSLKPYIRQKWIFNRPFKGYSRLALLFSPKLLFKRFINDEYDIIVSFLEGFPSRIVAGCENKNTKLISWIHLELYKSTIGYEFRNAEEASKLYQKFDKICCVAETVKQCFQACVKIPDEKIETIYNPLEIKELEDLSATTPYSKTNRLRLVTVGRLNPQKGYDRLLRVASRLQKDDLNFELHILGTGPMEHFLNNYVVDNHLEDRIVFHGFRENPYPFIRFADAFVCSSLREGYSTVVTESVLLETPVITVNCSGMREILGESGIIVDNNENALYLTLKEILLNQERLSLLKDITVRRAKILKERNSYQAIEELLYNL